MGALKESVAGAINWGGRDVGVIFKFPFYTWKGGIYEIQKWDAPAAMG